MTVWYDASTIPAEDGAKLSGLANQAATGAEFDAKQENEAFQPTYVAKSAYKGLPAIRMNADSFLQIGGDGGFDLTDMTIVAVMTPRKLVNNQQICSRKKDQSPDHSWYFNLENSGGHNFGWFDGNSHSKPNPQPSLSIKTPYTLVALKDGADSAVYVNGEQTAFTGGMGAIGNEEAYGPDCNPPNDGCCETCAQVAMGFISEYPGLTFGKSKYADIVEKYIYDGVLGGTGLDGKTFFYQQPLSAKDRERWDWHGCPCCPPMFLKLYSELATYIYAYNDSNVYVNQFISSKTTLENGVSIEQTTEMPWGGKTTLKVNGADAPYATESGYAVLSASSETTVEVEFPMEARREYSDENVVYNRGKVALAYGPTVYCFESTDHMTIPNFKAGDGNLGVPVDAVLKTQFEPDLLASRRSPWKTASMTTRTASCAPAHSKRSPSMRAPTAANPPPSSRWTKR